MTNNIKDIEDSVQKVYQKVNPSFFDIESDKTKFNKIQSELNNTYENLLCFPTRIFSGAKLIEYGCGTGEYSLFYLLNNAECKFIEVNPKACVRAREVFKHFSFDNKYELENISLFDYKDYNKYDIVVSNGVIHHTGNKKLAFEILSDSVSVGGFLLLGIATQSGFFQRNLQRMVISAFLDSNDVSENFNSLSDDEKITLIAETLFEENINRAEKIGRRLRSSIIHDTYINPQIDAPTIKELLDWAKENGMSLYSAWPPVRPSLYSESNVREEYDINQFSNLLSISELGWLSNSSEDPINLRKIDLELVDLISSLNSLTDSLNTCPINQNTYKPSIKTQVSNLKELIPNLDPYRDLKTNLKMFLDEVSECLNLIESKNFSGMKNFVTKTNILFRGTCGLGHNQFIFHKKNNGI